MQKVIFILLAFCCLLKADPSDYIQNLERGEKRVTWLSYNLEYRKALHQFKRPMAYVIMIECYYGQKPNELVYEVRLLLNHKNLNETKLALYLDKKLLKTSKPKQIAKSVDGDYYEYKISCTFLEEDFKKSKYIYIDLNGKKDLLLKNRKLLNEIGKIPKGEKDKWAYLESIKF